MVSLIHFAILYSILYLYLSSVSNYIVLSMFVMQVELVCQFSASKVVVMFLYQRFYNLIVVSPAVFMLYTMKSERAKAKAERNRKRSKTTLT